MDELTNLLKNVNIEDTLSKKIFALVNTDLDRIVNQMISDNHSNQTNTKIYSLFENIIHFSYEELDVLYKFLSKNGYHILQTKLKNTGLYYKKQFSNKSDIEILGGDFLKKNYSIHPPYSISL